MNEVRIQDRPDYSDGPALSSRDRFERPEQPKIEVGLLTGGQDKPYALGLATALASRGVRLDFIGSDEVDDPQLHSTSSITFRNLRGSQRRNASLREKVSRVLIYYFRIIGYAAFASPKVLHILWNNKFEIFDRTFLTLYYKMLGKKVVLTAHNVNTAKRDSSDSFLNRLSLKIQYRLVDHIFVHTERMKTELAKNFGLRENTITVIPFGVNNTVPNTSLTSAEARRRLGIKDGEKTILFFGRIGPYKGLEYLVTAFQGIAAQSADYALIIAGQPKVEATEYFEKIQQTLVSDATAGHVIQKIEFISDADTELYFKAADLLVLPYTEVFQSGVLFLSYSFGLPVIATRVGSFQEDIIEGRTGFTCKACNADDLARSIDTYFESDLYKALSSRRNDIQNHVNTKHSWDLVADSTRSVYDSLLGLIAKVSCENTDLSEL